MSKFGLVVTIRQANPYRKMAKMTHEHRTCPTTILNATNGY